MRDLRLYRLTPKGEDRYLSPWYPLKGTASEIVVWASSEAEARRLASAAGAYESRRSKPWKSKEWSDCEVVDLSAATVVSRQIVP